MNGEPHQEPPRLLLVTLSNIGDLVMTTPVLAALNETFPNALIDIVADRRSGDLLAACPYLGEVIWKNKQALWQQQWQLLKKIRARQYLMAVDLRGPWLAYLARCKQSARKYPRDKNMHAVEHHFTAVSPFVATQKIPWTVLWISANAHQQAKELLGDAVSKRLLALAPGANWPGKIWPAEHYLDLIQELSASFEGVCLLGGKDDMPRCADIAERAALPCIDVSGRANLMVSAACLARAKYFVGNDSGLGHIAAALNVPSLTVFGPGEPERYRPWGAHAEVILAPNQDLNALRPQAVASHVNRLLGER